KGVPHRRIPERVGDVKELCGVKDVEKKLIGTLSKGYRQRVGLADALLHEPDLLILDEPTIGLDPNQIRQVRELIKNLGKQHTILLSTHILPEVEMTCTRVIIINKGRIEACDTPENLLGRIRPAGACVRSPSRPADDVQLASASPLLLTGLLTSLWTAPGACRAAAVLADVDAGSYESSHRTLSCAR